MWFVGLLLLAAAGGLYYGYRSKQKRLRQIVSTEVYTVEHLRQLASSMAEGFGSGSLRFPAAVAGKVRCSEPLTSELAEVPAVYYSMRVTREYEEDRSQRSDKDRHHGPSHGSDQVAGNKRSVPFEVEDATGLLAVEPSGAKFYAEQALSRFEPAADGSMALRVGGFSLEVPVPPTGGSRTLGYRFHEEVISLGREVYVLGEVSDPGGELRIGPPEGKGEMLVSLKSRAQLVKELGAGSKGMKVGAVVCAVLGVLLVLFG